MSDYTEELKLRVASIVAPIPGDKAVGVDASYDPEFERVKSELDKLSSVSSGAPDWREVIATSDRLLEVKTKDLRLLVWLTLARLRVHGLAGLAEGLIAMKTLCESHWEDMYPPIRRARARGNLADWLHENVASILQSLEPTASDRVALTAAQSLLDDLDTFLTEKLSDAYGGLGSLRSLLRDKVRQLPAETPQSGAAGVATQDRGAAVASAGTQATGAPASASTGTFAAPELPSITGAADALPALRTLGKGVVEVVRHLRRADPAQAGSYRLQRTGIWLAISDAPPAEGGKTRLPPPPADIKKKLEMRIQAGQWMDLLSTAEDLTSTYLFWIDLHRLVATAMDRLGALFVDARSTVARDVLAFLDRLPMIMKLSFSDGTPFADVGTQTWIDDERARQGASSGTQGTGSARMNEEDEELARRFEEARDGRVR